MHKLKLIIILFLIQLVNNNCDAQKATLKLTVDDRDIILDVFNRKGIVDAVLLKQTLNEKLKSTLSEEIVFEDENYPEFGDLRLIFSDEIINEVFNKTQVANFINQLITHEYLKQSPIKNIAMQDTVARNKNFLTLSIPVYTKDNRYAIIAYGSGNIAYEVYESGSLLYKKINGKWIFLNGFFNSIQ